nr:Gp49 family protein [Paraburkholderia sp. C35]
MNMATQTPRNGDEKIEDEIVRKGKTAPRVTPSDIEAAIIDELYFTAHHASIGLDVSPFERPEVASRAHMLLTFCVLTLRNGFTVTGESACASPENFDIEIGRKIARQNAVQKIWPLEGYLLKQRLFAAADSDGGECD